MTFILQLTDSVYYGYRQQTGVPFATDQLQSQPDVNLERVPEVVPEGSVTGNITGSATGIISGCSTGNVTGSFTGNRTGGAARRQEMIDFHTCSPLPPPPPGTTPVIR